MVSLTKIMISVTIWAGSGHGKCDHMGWGQCYFMGWEQAW